MFSYFNLLSFIEIFVLTLLILIIFYNVVLEFRAIKIFIPLITNKVT